MVVETRTGRTAREHTVRWVIRAQSPAGRRLPFALRAAVLCILVFAAPPAVAPSQGGTGDRGRLEEQFQADLNKKAYDEALAVLGKLIESDPANYQLFNLRGVVNERMGHFPEATTSYLKALELQPSSLTVRLNLALNYLRLERWDDAAREFAALIEQEGTTTPPPANPYQQAPVGDELDRFAHSLRADAAQYFSLGRLFLRHRLAEGALTIFFAGTQAVPKSSALYYGLGWAFQDLGRFGEAQASFRRALQLQPDYFECCQRLGYSYLTLNEAEEAAETYRGCVGMNPQNYAGHYYLGMALIRGKAPDVPEAIAQFQQAVRLNPSSVDSRLELGKAYAASGSNEEALREFKIAAREDPENAEAQYRLATLYRQLHRNEEARKHLEQFENLKARELARMRDETLSPFGLPRSTVGETSDAVVAFYAKYQKALANRNYDEIWGMLTDRSKALYGDDAKRFREALSNLSPALVDRMLRSSISGGKLFHGRIICEFRPVDGVALPPLVLFKDGDKLLLDYSFDMSLEGLAHLGAGEGR